MYTITKAQVTGSSWGPSSQAAQAAVVFLHNCWVESCEIWHADLGQHPDSCHQFHVITSNTLAPPMGQRWSVFVILGEGQKSFTHTFLPIFTKIGTDDLQTKPYKIYQMDF